MSSAHAVEQRASASESTHPAARETIKVKCAGWREANKERWRLFEKTGEAMPEPHSHRTERQLRPDNRCSPRDAQIHRVQDAFRCDAA